MMYMFDIIFTIVPILVFSIFIFVVVLMFNPKLRGKFQSRQIKATKYMMDESKEDLTDIMTTMGNVQVKSKKNILDQNEETLQNMSNRYANITKDGIETTVRAIKKGLAEEDKMYCKHCGQLIDKDSKFCKNCGKEQ